ncbi:MAG: threonine/serine exporter family protein, partial [Acholeplasmataceae bacterium]
DLEYIQNYFAMGQILNKKMTLALDIGEQMVKSGSEVSKVEDSIKKVLDALGCKNAAVLVITTSIIVTINVEAYGTVTETRRLQGVAYDMDRLSKINNLIKEICSMKIGIDEAKETYRKILNEKPYSFSYQVFFAMGIAFTFTLFFGGSIKDALVSMIIAIVIKLMGKKIEVFSENKFLYLLASSLVGGILAVGAVSLGIADSVSKISIGDIMILIPGVALTNSIRDMLSGDTITGQTRFLESSLIAVMIAFGFVMPSVFFDNLFTNSVAESANNTGRLTIILAIIIELIIAFFGTFSYAGSFNVKKDKIFYAAFGGLIGWGTYILSGYFVSIEPFKYLFAAIIVNFYAEKMSEIKKTPTTVFLVSAIMPLVPGSGLYETMASLLSKNWEQFGIEGVNTLAVALAIAFGTLISNFIVKMMRNIKKKRLIKNN